MGSSDRGRDDAPGTHRDPAATGNPTGGADAYANWLERMQRAREIGRASCRERVLCVV